MTISSRFMPLIAAFVASGVALYTGLAEGGFPVFLFVLSGWLVSLCLHEFGHAWAAYRGGDRSVAAKGYLTLDPLAYTQPAISLILPAVFVALGGIGLPGGAVYVDHAALRGRGWRSFVSLAGPIATALFLIGCAAPFVLGVVAEHGAPSFWAGLAMLAFLQASALAFNLLPVPGFDGFGAVAPFLPPQVERKANDLAQPAMLIIFALFVFAPQMMRPFFSLVASIVTGVGVDPRYIALGFKLFRFWA
ncbi:MAG: site-2 protease family protein [Rhizobiales bacterium]|nr:site-2 protease family protein [Hyphomicrobiales bacterium]